MTSWLVLCCVASHTFVACPFLPLTVGTLKDDMDADFQVSEIMGFFHTQIFQLVFWDAL